MEMGKNSLFGCIEFPNIKLERPEIVASVDLTIEKQNQVENDLFWLDNLIHKARNVSQLRNQIKVLDTIILDDDIEGSLRISYKRNKNECLKEIDKMPNKQLLQSNMLAASKEQEMQKYQEIKCPLTENDSILSISNSSHYTENSFAKIDLLLKNNAEFKSTIINNRPSSKCESAKLIAKNIRNDECGVKRAQIDRCITENEQDVNLDPNRGCYNPPADHSRNTPRLSQLEKNVVDNVESQSDVLVNENSHANSNTTFDKKVKGDEYKICEENENIDAIKSNTTKSKKLVSSLKTYSNRRKKVIQNMETSKGNKITTANNECVIYSEKVPKRNENVNDTSKLIPLCSEYKTFLSMAENEGNVKTLIDLDGDKFQKLKENEGIEKANDLLKSTAKKQIVHESVFTVQKKKYTCSDIAEIKIPTDMENTLLDLPVFYSSEDEESCDSNILSILDESENSAEPKLDSIMNQNSNDDKPVQKISPSVNNSTIDYKLDTCLLRESNSNQTNALPSVETDFQTSTNQPNVIFSTSNCKLKNLNYEWIDPTVELEENFLSVQQSEISSPPIEEFTKSDKTLFQTFLNKVNETVIQTNLKHSGIQPSIISNTKTARSTALKQNSIICRTGFTEVSDNADDLRLLKFMPSTQRRKTVSFTDTDERTQKPVYKPFQHSNNQNRNKDAFWISESTTNGSHSRRSTFLSSCQQNTPSINTNSQQKRIESDKAAPVCNDCDEKLFNAYVNVQRVDTHAYFLDNTTNLKSNSKFIPVKKQNASVGRKISDFDKYLQRNKSKCIKNSFKPSGEHLTSPLKRRKLYCHLKGNRLNRTDSKLKKKAIVVLYDVDRYPVAESSNFLCYKANISFKKNDVIISTESRKETENSRISRLLLKRKNHFNYDSENIPQRKVSWNKCVLSVQDVSSSVVSPVNPSSLVLSPSSSNQNMNKPQGFDFFTNRDNPSEVEKFLQHISSSFLDEQPLPRKDEKKPVLCIQNHGSFKIDDNQDEREDNHVSSTQDNIPFSTQFVKMPVSNMLTEKDIQNNYVDTTLKESTLQMNNSLLENSLSKSRRNYASKSGFQDFLTTATVLNEQKIKHGCKNYEDVNNSNSLQLTVSNARISNSKDKSALSSGSNYEPSIDSHNILPANPISCDLSFETEHCLMDAAKTYSNINYTRTIFVPPDIEKIIESEG